MNWCSEPLEVVLLLPLFSSLFHFPPDHSYKQAIVAISWRDFKAVVFLSSWYERVIQLSRVSMSRNIYSWDISRSLMMKPTSSIQPRDRMDISEMQQNSNINQHTDVKGNSCCWFSSVLSDSLTHFWVRNWVRFNHYEYKRLLINEIKYECKYHSQFWHQNMCWYFV